MVYIKSEMPVKKNLEILKSLGTIVAIANHPVSMTAVYDDGSLRILKSHGVTSVSKYRVPEYIEKDPWLKFQMLINENTLSMSGVEQFCHRVDDYIWQANDMTCHNKFNIYFPFSNEWEVEIEII